MNTHINLLGLKGAILVIGMLFACEAHDTVEMHFDGTEDHNAINVCTSGTDCAGGCSSILDMCKIPIDPSQNGCLRAGVWKNELNSVMLITCRDGQIGGFYCSAVGQAKYSYPLSGRYLVGTSNTVIMGWTVAWQNPSMKTESSTSWSAISYTGDVIESQWLLTSYQTELWNTVRTNRDRFTKVIC